MIAGTNVLNTPGTERPKALESGLAESLTLPEQEPGWDTGPDRRIDDGRMMTRMLVLAGIGVAVLLGVGAVLRSRREG